MPHWIRIFGTNDWTPRATQLVEQLDSLGFDVTTEVMGEEDEWEQVSLETAGMETPVIVVTADPNPRTHRMALDEGVAAVVQKPFSARELYALVAAETAKDREARRPRPLRAR